LSGWGRTSSTASWVVRPEGATELAELLTGACHGPVGGDGTNARPGTASTKPPSLSARRTMIARGLGRSYGDAAQCAGGMVIDTSGFATIGQIDPKHGTVEVGGGACLADVMRHALAHGWFVAVTPGTRWVTVGGAIAADVHGKNHHRDGGFCAHVLDLTLMTPGGTVVVSPANDPDLFWATAGGMGLTGVVTRATLQLIAVDSLWMTVDTERFEQLDDVMAAMESGDAAHRYSVAWVDCTHRRGAPGRSVLTRGDHTPAAHLPPRYHDADPGREAPRLRVPVCPPVRSVTRSGIRLFNEVWFHRAPRRQMGALKPLYSFFHPLDGLADWNLLYGPDGFVQYQFVVGPDHGQTLRAAVSAIVSSGVPSSLAVLKRFGPGDPGPLSFPIEGWTLALDFPIGLPELPTLLDRLDDLVAGVGGRVYLAKDSRLRPELVELMYPRMGELAAVRARVDPDGVLQSDLSRRLGFTTGRSS
jgi:decaprenylphospho-beta-D-ribofuranose 2-oxidase